MLERDRGRLADALRRANLSPLGSGRAGRCRLPARPRRDGPGARLRRRDAQLARRRQRPRLRGGDRGGPGARDGPPVAAGRGDHLVVEPALRVRAGRRCLFDRVVDDAEQEEPRPGRAGPGPHGPRDRRPDGNADDAQGPAAGVPARPPGGQAAAVRGGRHDRCVSAHHGRPHRDTDRRPRGDGRRGARGLHHRDGRRRRAGPAGRAVPGRAPCRGFAGC